MHGNRKESGNKREFVEKSSRGKKVWRNAAKDKVKVEKVI